MTRDDDSPDSASDPRREVVSETNAEVASKEETASRHAGTDGRLLEDSDLDDAPPAPRDDAVVRSSSHRELERLDILAIVLSVFVPGLGHLIRGFAKRGLLIMLVGFTTCCTLGVLNVGAAFDLYCISMTEPYRSVGEWEFFPDVDKHLEA